MCLTVSFDERKWRTSAFPWAFQGAVLHQVWGYCSRYGTSGRNPGSGRPLKGRSAYHFYADEHRMRVWAEHPDMAPGEVGRILGEMWHAQTAAQRAPYERMAVADNERYQRELQEWLASREREEL
ncbi:endonuclease/exonuclease/phosphatase [Purpureocillium lavendulum]|uniref:Endonuclease/exonuclease/phosphatase n=1 Tax=Purpureocillium lavendulum TaxID=1247861 RepID=A0AB34FFF9_9HYPO|nr:endonuclease/exonuclease/phosphatase [Purpureocillium lavendulum]